METKVRKTERERETVYRVTEEGGKRKIKKEGMMEAERESD